MKVHVKWRILADSGEFLIDVDDLDGAINWESLTESEKIDVLEQHMVEQYMESYAIVESFTEVNG